MELDCGVTSGCLAVLLALVNVVAGALFGARRHPFGELRAVFGYPPVSAVGESGKPREGGCREPTGRQHSQERRYRRASRASLAGRRDQVPRGHPLSGREFLQQVVGLGSLQRDQVQARRAVPPQQGREQPRAEVAIRVVEDRPAAFAGQAGRALTGLSIVRHVDTNHCTRRSPRRGARATAATSRRTISVRTGRFTATQCVQRYEAVSDREGPCHRDTCGAAPSAVGSPVRACHARSICRVNAGYTSRCRNGRIAAM